VHSIGLLILAGVLVGVIFAPRRWAALCMLAAVFYLTQGQSFNVAGVNMFAFRFVELAAFVRVLAKKEWSWSRVGGIDKALLFLFLFLPVAYLSHSPEEYAFAIGQSVDAITCYFAFRGLLQNFYDVRWLLTALVWLLAPYAVLMISESVTQKNVFELMGGLKLDVEKWTRGGRLRCQGAFRHGSLMGSVAASFIPLYVGMAFSPEVRRRAVVGVLSCVAMVWASNSGGPLNCLAVGAVGWGLWSFRRSMHLVRRLIVLAIMLAALGMKAPIWYLPARAASLSGGDGWHRSYLIEMAFKNVEVWWVRGCDIAETREWLPYALGTTGGADITNQYLKYGVQGGAVTMICFIAMLVLAFMKVGRDLAATRERALVAGGRHDEAFLWGFGVVLVVHAVNWIGISYFDQSYAVWYCQLACVAGGAVGISVPVAVDDELPSVS
jgi:hypothetical protein